MNNHFQNIAVLQTAFLGDVALAMPLCNALKSIYPNSRLTFITTKAASPIAEIVTSIDEVIVFDKRNAHSGFKGTLAFGKFLKEFKFDLFISLHRSFRSTLIAKLAKADYSIAYDTAVLSFLFDKKCKYQLHEHEIRRNLNFLSCIEKGQYIDEFDNPAVNLNFSAHDINYVEQYLNQIGNNSNKIALIAPNSVWETKKWIKTGYINLAEILTNNGFQVLIIGSQSDKDYCDEISQKIGAINTCGIFTIPQTIYLMKKSQFLVSNDSAPIHFAGMVNCPVVAIFGPTSPLFGFYPRSEQSTVIERAELNCKPCEIHGNKKCPIGTFDCMNLIKAEEVANAAMNITSTQTTQ
jgi:heptosyltransferase II